MSELSEDDETFLRMVKYFHDSKGDLTRGCDWDEERLERLAPSVHLAWKNFVRAERALDDAISRL